MSRIVSILPKGEGFNESRFGAIALCLRDFTRASRHCDETLVIGGATAEGFAGIRYACPSRARWFESRTRAYANGAATLIRREKAVLAEIHNRPKLLKLIAQKTPCKLALHLHNDPQDMEGTRTPQERAKLLERTSAVYCVSNFIRDRFAEGLPRIAQDKLHVIYNGLEIPQTFPEKENLIVFAGRMTEGKGALLLAQALRIALPHLPSWKAVLIGSTRHEAGNKEGKHEALIRETLAPLKAQVEWPGFLPHEATLGYFARAGIAVVPSLWQEPFGRTALEAMAYGCAVISSGRGALREVTADAALTLPQMTPDILAHDLTSLAQDEAALLSYSRLARERSAYFAIRSRTETLDAVRDSILQEKTHAE